MKCAKCQHENPEGAKFCNECAHNLGLESDRARKDLLLDQKLEKIQRYLPKGLTGRILFSRDKIEGEHRQVTVMFCDMEGFTQLADKIGPEKTYTFMDQIYEILIYNVHHYEGTVNEFTGDGIMALFGAPIALEDAPYRALRSALSIHKEIAQFSEKQEIPVEMRIGINTGPVVVGSLGNDLRVEFTAVGDTVNLASRMEGLAEPGTTYVTKATFQLTEGLFRFEAIGEKEVKGKEKPVFVYKLLSANEDVYRPRLGTERMIYSEMVGRDKQLNRLQLQVMKAVNGEGSVINIIGEAGIGKSRLMAELRKRDVMNQVTLIEGRSISIGRNLSFHPIIDLLKQWARIKEEDFQALAFEKLEIAVRGLCQEGTSEVLPFLATMMGMKLTGKNAERVRGIEGEALEKLIMKAVREVLIKATEMTALLIVMEDLHWADTSSIELILSLARLAKTQRIVFINVFRPGYEETSNCMLESLNEDLPDHYVEISLESLDERMSETLISNMLNFRELHHPIIDQIVERSDGNPFFIEEVVRSFIDEGAVIIKNGSFEVTNKINAIVIPQTINGVLMARIDRLEEKTRDLVKIASVIGRNFFHRILVEVVRIVEDIEGKLSYLKGIELIRERKRWGELEYLFKHALAQQVAYESILMGKRTELHLRVANCIENIFRERLREFFGMLAYHYSMGEDEDKAEEYLIKAGEEALKSSASSEALHFYREALTLFMKKHTDDADPEKKAMIEKNIAIALHNRGRFTESVLYFEQALAFYGEKPRTNPFTATITFILSAFSFVANLYLPRLRLGKCPTEMDNEMIDLMYRKTSAIAVTDPKKMFIFGLYFFRKIRSFDVGQVKNGLAYLTSESPFMSWSGVSFGLARKALESIKDKVPKSDVRVLLYYKGAEILYVSLGGAWGNETEFDEGLVDASADIGEFFWASIYTYWHGYLDVEKGRLQGAKDKIDKLSELADSYDNNYSKILKYALNVVFLVKCRNYHEALIESEEGINFGIKAGLSIWVFSILSMKARVQTIFDEPGEAEQSLSRASQLKSEINIVPFYLCNFSLSQFALDIWRLRESQRNDNEAELIEAKKNAMKSGRKAVALSRKAAPERTEVYRLMGTYCWIIGKQKGALKQWAKGIQESERISAHLELSRTYFEVGKRLFEEDSKYKALNGIKAEEYLDKARSMFTEMDLQWDLNQLERIAA